MTAARAAVAAPELMRAETLWDLIRLRASATPDAPMLIDASDRRMTYAQFADAAERLAAGFFELGIGPGTPVTWQLPTRITTVLVMAALVRLGAAQNPIIHLYRERETRAVLKQSRSEFFLIPGQFGSRDFAAFASGVTAELESRPRIITVETDPARLPAGDIALLPAPPAPGDEVRWIPYTSGTTSDPKGVCHTDRSIMAAGYGLAHALRLTARDVGTIAYPIAHIGGPMYLVMMLMNGMSAVLIESFVAAQAVGLLRRWGVTQSGGSTTHYLAYLEEQRKQPNEPLIPSLRMLTGGGAPKPPELYWQLKRELNCAVMHAYGMTEVPLIAQGSPLDSDEQLANTEGHVISGMEVRIVKADGALARHGEEGEVRVRGASVCRGYTNVAANASAFDADGFFRTGDMGILREDGHVTLTGRVKDIIIRKGENIAAKELEELLFAHPKVGAVAVIGLPDRERGERVCAVVETKPGAEPLQFAEMVAYLKDAGLMLQKIPEQLEIIEQLPRNETFNKVLKHKLRERFAGTWVPPR
jgi:acyl-CoA synthetase (AMP-forming)/AMP-acid ligase II